MGIIHESTPDMGSLTVECRTKSFYVTGDEVYTYAPDGDRGTVEINYADIPKVRAALDLAEKNRRDL